MYTLASLHDVAPPMADKVFRLWDLCREAGVRPALCVVPNWHGAWPLERHPRFVAWLQDRAAEGTEIVLHGERHDEVGSPRRWGDTLGAWHHTARVAEFLSLDSAASGARISRGVRLLGDLGLPPVGFIPPAWLCRGDSHRAARSAGLGFTEDLKWLHLHRLQTRERALLIRWSGANVLRALTLAALGTFRWRRRHRYRLVRVALHPCDVDVPLSLRCVSHALREWLGEHPPVTYADVAGSGADDRTPPPARSSDDAKDARMSRGGARSDRQGPAKHA